MWVHDSIRSLLCLCSTNTDIQFVDPLVFVSLDLDVRKRGVERELNATPLLPLKNSRSKSVYVDLTMNQACTHKQMSNNILRS